MEFKLCNVLEFQKVKVRKKYIYQKTNSIVIRNHTRIEENYTII